MALLQCFGKYLKIVITFPRRWFPVAISQLIWVPEQYFFLPPIFFFIVNIDVWVVYPWLNILYVPLTIPLEKLRGGKNIARASTRLGRPLNILELPKVLDMSSCHRNLGAQPNMTYNSMLCWWYNYCEICVYRGLRAVWFYAGKSKCPLNQEYSPWCVGSKTPKPYSSVVPWFSIWTLDPASNLTVSVELLDWVWQGFEASCSRSCSWWKLWYSPSMSKWK